MAPASHESSAVPQVVITTKALAPPRTDQPQPRNEPNAKGKDPESGPIPAPDKVTVDEDPRHPTDTPAPVDLTGALEKQAQRSDANEPPRQSSPPNNNNEANEAGTRSPVGESTDSLIDNPPNLARIRRLLFECKDPIEITQEEFETYWPFVDNFWVKQRTNASHDGHCTTEYYMCRLRRATNKPSETKPPLPEGKRPRKRRAREGGICNVSIKVVRFEGAYSAVTIYRTPGSDAAHSHDLEYIDRVKRNSGVMEYVRRESFKGYLPSSTYKVLLEQKEKLDDAGGSGLSVTDVRNVSAKWRIQNPEVELRTHDGWEYVEGRGVVKTQTTSQTPQQNPPPTSISTSTSTPLPLDTLSFPTFSLDFLEPYLPAIPKHHNEKHEFPHVTLSYASSMDSKISLRAGMQTVLSGPEAKLMTHYLRSRHDAILVGVGTVLSDNPGLNCRLEGAGGFGGLGRMWQPRPVVIDPTGRWPIHPEDRMLRTAVEGKGRAPWVVVSPGASINADHLMMLKGYGGDFLRIMEYNLAWRIRWEAILRSLALEGIKSVMIEGGGTVLNELLNPEYSNIVDSIIVTVAPTYLGQGGVSVSPESKQDVGGNPNAALNPHSVKWTPLGQNVIMCGKIRSPEPPK
ncbi:hypothetical protein N7478_009078 [Penicillium angulare]|uniref:uncharacterized protein n=1 Tax=Penicillium angulare TaxID=116970 RepID=UPI002540FFBD|nr:uncharacterized protein N7478_009078 [Penicillium angulare]KAJ5273953.1 hypothetical protein N7478_009078 [Penicillium angulare]